jgi:hypothetical protein
LFGDIADPFVVGRVDVCDLIGTEADALLTVGRSGFDGEPFATQGFRNFPEASFEVDMGFDRANATGRLARAKVRIASIAADSMQS